MVKKLILALSVSTLTATVQPSFAFPFQDQDVTRRSSPTITKASYSMAFPSDDFFSVSYSPFLGGFAWPDFFGQDIFGGWFGGSPFSPFGNFFEGFLFEQPSLFSRTSFFELNTFFGDLLSVQPIVAPIPMQPAITIKSARVAKKASDDDKPDPKLSWSKLAEMAKAPQKDEKLIVQEINRLLVRLNRTFGTIGKGTETKPEDISKLENGIKEAETHVSSFSTLSPEAQKMLEVEQFTYTVDPNAKQERAQDRPVVKVAQPPLTLKGRVDKLKFNLAKLKGAQSGKVEENNKWFWQK